MGLAVAAFFAATLLLACSSSNSTDNGATDGGGTPLKGSITVFAAASLTESFTELGQAFKTANPGVDVKFNFAGSSALRTQLEQGAPADVFASANPDQMDAAVQSNVIEGEPQIFVHNSLVIITPKDNPAGIESPADLKKSGLKLVLADPQVPVGNYAREMLQNLEQSPDYGAGFSDAVLANLVSNEANVKDVVAKVELGEADAGVVYGTDVTQEVAPDLKVIQIPDQYNVIADYPIAATSDAKNPTVAKAFVDFVLSSDGQAIMQKYNFVPVN